MNFDNYNGLLIITKIMENNYLLCSRIGLYLVTIELETN